MGYYQIDLAEVRNAEGKLYLFVAIRPHLESSSLELAEPADMQAALAFLEALIAAEESQGSDGPLAWSSFDRVCRLHGIDHRLTKPHHPWTNGQVARMKRTIKEATTVQRYPYDIHNRLRTHLSDFIAAYNRAKRLKTLGGLTAYEVICKCWLEETD